MSDEEIEGIKDGKKTIIRNIQNTDLPESEIKNAIADGGEIIDDVFKMIKDKGLSPTEVKKIATELFDGTFTSTGKASVAKSKTAQREVAFMLTHWLKETVPESKELHAYRDWETDRKSTRLNSSHITRSRMPSSA